MTRTFEEELGNATTKRLVADIIQATAWLRSGNGNDTALKQLLRERFPDVLRELEELHDRATTPT